MQAHAHIPGQVSGEAGGQLSGLTQQNGSSLPSQASNVGGLRRPWHADSDLLVARQSIYTKICNILQVWQQRKSQPDPQSQRMPEFAKRLEEFLFNDAASKEEYMDYSTLDRRIQDLFCKYAQQSKQPKNFNQGFVPHSASSVGTVGTMIPTPGMPNSGNGNSMIPSNGGDISMMSGPASNTMVPSPVGMGSMLPAGNGSDQIHSNSFMTSDRSSSKMVHASVPNNNIFSNCGDNLASMPGSLGNILRSQQGVGGMSIGTANQVMNTIGGQGAVNRMIPTPGSGTSQSVLMKAASSGGMGYSNVEYMGSASPNQFSSAQNAHIYRNMSGQIGGTMGGINMQRKNSSYGLINENINSGIQLGGNNQHLVNGSTTLSNSGGYLNASQYGNLQIPFRQNVTQQHPQHFMQSAVTNQMASLAGDGYAMNAADLAGSGNLYATASSGRVAATSSLNGNTLGLQPTKMIPVPGLPSQEQKLPTQEQGQQNQSQHAGVQHGLSVLPRGQSLQSQQQQQQKFQHHHNQHQQQGHQYQTHSHQQVQQVQQQQQMPVEKKGIVQNQSELMVFGEKQGGVETSQREMPEQNSFSLPPSEQQQLPVNDPLVRQSEVSNDNSLKSQQLSPEQSQKLHKLQVLSSEEQKRQPFNVYNDLPAQVKSEVNLQREQELQSQEKLQHSQQSQSFIEHQQPPQQEPPQVHDQEMTQQHQPCQQVLGNGVISSASSQPRCGTAGGSGGPPAGNVQHNDNADQRKMQYAKQQRWLLFLRHASKCSVPEGQCQTPHCSIARELWSHITRCRDRQCSYARCQASRTLLSHHQRCSDRNCPVCGPVREFLMRQRANVHSQSSNPGASASDFVNAVSKSSNLNATVGNNINLPSSSITSMHDKTKDQEPPIKKAKIEPTSPGRAQQLEKSLATVINPSEMQGFNQMKTQGSQPSVHDAGLVKVEVSESIKSDAASMKVDQIVDSEQVPCHKSSDSNRDTCQHPLAHLGHGQVKPVKAELATPLSGKVLKPTKQEPMQVKEETKIHVSPPEGSASGKNVKSKNKAQGVSMTELFTPEMVREHIRGLRQWVGQSKAKAEKNQALEHQMSENACQLCAVEKLTFEPPPVYCSSCGNRVKRNAPYYFIGGGDTRYCFCLHCYSGNQSDTVKIDGLTFPKSKLMKKRNEEETEEAWVQCDKCNTWQHQICALFNGRRNEGGQAEYTCPKCYVIEIERGVRKPLPQSAVLGAKDLPRTILSDHIEQRLFRRLKQERQERAKALGKNFEEVPGAEALVVRVVSSVDKKLEVKPRFLELFQHEGYPTEFSYKSKALLLFQKIEGVEVCLFGMYVQEFGSDCSHPNQRRVYLSYLDSVKYFRPDVKTVTGEALRTFVYHEILIGYLEYCKRRGLASCYIWACPPLKGEDYILYCHPEIQKTPKSDKLREWYLTMLRKASKDEIVVEVTNLYDHFFVSTGERKAKVTTARLPYFDGDYWPGAAEEFLTQFQQEEEEGRKNPKLKKSGTKRSSKVAAQAELASSASKDTLLMQKLGDNIHQMKEDFIMVHLQHACTHCCLFIVSGKRWVCKHCKNLNLCDKCYEAEQKLDERDRHPINSREKHMLFPIDVTDVPADTTDTDEIMESEFFDTRQAFLSLCQGNHYQYDTLRRAKHSSMMVLYHLHNPTAPAFVTTCNICHNDIETGQGWRCETCPDFDLCNDCYTKDDSVKHPHRLTPHPSIADRDAQNQEARQKRVQQLRKMLDLLIHASRCGSPQCGYQNCRKVKGLFRHGMQCRTRLANGCNLCKRMWYILQIHARACKESECCVPRCKDLKQHMRRLQLQSESRRRAAVMEMMRQRIAGNSH